MSKPLEGVKVIELATFIAAATAGRFMADLGADVIKIESAKGDPLRYTAPSEGRPLDMYENTTWDLENGNKRCISLNMKTLEGKEAFFKLLDSADVLITNWRVQALQRAGLDYETLKERYPKLVYAICTGYGEYGPDKDLPGFDFTAFFARGGYFETLRQRSDVPFNGAPGVGDHNVGMNLVAGILAALYQAKTKGVGEKVETSLFESAVYNMGMMVQASNYEGIAQQYPINIRNGANPFNSAWHTADDRYIQTCMPDYNTYYKKFIAAVGREDLVENGVVVAFMGILARIAAFFVVPEMVVERRLGVWSCGIPFAEELIAHLWVETDQIKEKKYIGSLEPHIGDILLVGINYDKKTKKNECLIEKA